MFSMWTRTMKNRGKIQTHPKRQKWSHRSPHPVDDLSGRMAGSVWWTQYSWESVSDSPLSLPPPTQLLYFIASSLSKMGFLLVNCFWLSPAADFTCGNACPDLDHAGWPVGGGLSPAADVASVDVICEWCQGPDGSFVDKLGLPPNAHMLPAVSACLLFCTTCYFCLGCLQTSFPLVVSPALHISWLVHVVFALTPPAPTFPSIFNFILWKLAGFSSIFCHLQLKLYRNVYFFFSRHL